MIKVHVDGQTKEIQEGATLKEIIPDIPEKYSVAIIKSSKSSEYKTKNIRFFTSSGEVVIELNTRGIKLFSDDYFRKLFDKKGKSSASDVLSVKWSDRQATTFGPFKSAIVPDRKQHRYNKGDVILGCGGYDPENSYLIFSRMPHVADHGADKSGGVIGSVVSGKNSVHTWKPGDIVKNAERIVSTENTSDSFATTDRSLQLEDGMEIITHVTISAYGYDKDKISIDASNSVEHMLITLKGGEFQADLNSSGFVRDEKMKKSTVPQEIKKSRLEGTVTVRTSGRLEGSLYIYTKDIPGSPNHTVVGEIKHGIELVKLIRKGDAISVKTIPGQIDLRGLSLKESLKILNKNGIKPSIDDNSGERVVIDQKPPNTMEVLEEKKVSLKTVPLSNVIGIRLNDTDAPRTCGIFREVTGLRWYNIGKMPLLFKYDDVTLFQPKVPRKITINIENTPRDTVPANMLAMTNDSRRGVGLVGVRTSSNNEFGPTSEPFSATNIIGEVIETDKLSSLKEGETVYIREI
ncbi:putative methanogenesis marker protein 3 [Methanomicrobium sp. W14]|uniref:methyl-coenzyme M reductase-associated protein Mmp3 n=1 Tax=Methanomicrobium sp. W14 TaxID=2817839 RepID=UPI001AE0ED55|nr:methanogenesis marker 3 protein [Methanomicrobium sp. W14]MBP2132913.1 putative methanogenesis marker protein 3 [Methanomicrobium sp. W14]